MSIYISWVWPPPSNSGKWRFRSGSPTKNVIILVVTVTITLRFPWLESMSIYKWYISGIYCQLGGYMPPIPPFRGTRNNHWIYAKTSVKTYSIPSWNCGIEKKTTCNVAVSGVHRCCFFRKLDNVRYTRCSMYGIFTYIYPKNYPNVGKYTMRWVFGYRLWIIFRWHVGYVRVCLYVSTRIVQLSNAYSDLKTHGLDLTSFWVHPGKLTFWTQSLKRRWMVNQWFSGFQGWVIFSFQAVSFQGCMVFSSTTRGVGQTMPDFFSGWMVEDSKIEHVQIMIGFFTCLDGSCHILQNQRVNIYEYALPKVPQASSYLFYIYKFEATKHINFHMFKAVYFNQTNRFNYNHSPNLNQWGDTFSFPWRPVVSPDVLFVRHELQQRRFHGYHGCQLQMTLPRCKSEVAKKLNILFSRKLYIIHPQTLKPLLKRDHFKRNVVFQSLFFRRYVSLLGSR